MISSIILFVYSFFTIQKRVPFRFGRGQRQQEKSVGVRRTKMVSSPKHSILCHGMIISSSLHIPKKPSLPAITRARIFASSQSNSKSLAHPSLVPSHKLIISNLRKSRVLHRFIRKFSPLKSVLLHCMQAREIIWLSDSKKAKED